MGYPIYADWNYARYFAEYRLVIVVFPLLTIAGFVALTSLARLGGLYAFPGVAGTRVPAQTEPVTGQTERVTPQELPLPRIVGGHLLRSAVVGGVLGAQVAIARNAAGSGFWWQFSAGALVLTAASAAALAFVRRRSDLAEKVAAWLTGLGAVATVPGLALIAANTEVTVRSGGAIHTYDWFPAGVAFPVTLAAAAAVLGSFWRYRADVDAERRVASRSVAFLAAPVIVYLAYATIPGQSNGFSFFEDGQLLAVANFLTQGKLPYRDFYAFHGVLYDGIQPLVGMSLLSHSYWGMSAGIYLIMFPLGMVILYVFSAAMYVRAWPLALLAVLLPGYLQRPAGMYAALMTPYVRFMLWPMVLILLMVALSRRAIAWSIVLGVSLVFTALVTPEAAYFIPAVGIAVIARDVYCRDRGWRSASFRRTIAVTVGGVIATTPVAGFLIVSRSLGSFIEFYRIAATDHSLIAASQILVNLHDPIIFFAAASPVAATLLTMLWVGLRLRWRLPLTDLDWVLVAAALLTAVYYEKWLASPDLHVLESYGAALPLLLGWVARVLIVLDSAADRYIRSRVRTNWIDLPVSVRSVWTGSPVSVAAVAISLIAMQAAVLTWAPLTAHQYRTTVASSPQNPELGYMARGVVNNAQIEDIRTFLAAYLQPGDGIFDFSNTPGLYYYLLPYKPVTLNYEVSLVSNQRDQDDVISQLRHAKPEFVVFNSLGGIGLPIIGGVWNMTRLYFISQYILANYRPFAMVRGEVYYVRNTAVLAPPSSVSLRQQPVTQGLDFVTPCDWGYGLNFLSARPANPGAGQTLETVPAGPSATLTAPPGLEWNHFGWLQVRFGRSTPRQDALAILDNQAPYHAITFGTTGRGPSTLWLPISACAQWHGYASETLTITQTNPQPLTLRLVP